MRICFKKKEEEKTEKRSCSHHDGVDKSHNVDGPDRAEAGQHGQEEVVFYFGPVQGRVGGDAGVARN